MRFLVALLFFISLSAVADTARITKASASCNSDRVCRFTVSVLHADSGWDHYADGWDVLSDSGKALGKRVLLHPHVNEQPFTRSLSNVTIPPEINRVYIRVHDSKHGYSKQTYPIDIRLP